jgi:hypothetical protein
MDQQQSTFHLVMELCFYMAVNSLKISHKNKSPYLQKSFMMIMVYPSQPYKAYLYMKSMEEWIKPNSPTHILVKTNFTIFGIKSQKSGFFINLGRFELGIHPYLPNQFEF